MIDEEYGDRNDGGSVVTHLYPLTKVVRDLGLLRTFIRTHSFFCSIYVVIKVLY